jgi:phosphohistidine swiveling domain-containing protein
MPRGSIRPVMVEEDSIPIRNNVTTTVDELAGNTYQGMAALG